MQELTATRWRRYGKDRVYVKAEDGSDVGHFDLVSGDAVLTAPEFELEFAEIVREWKSESTAELTLSMPEGEPVELVTTGRDLSENVAGAAARAKRDEVRRQAPVRNMLARVLRVKTEERAWRVGAKGETKVGHQLDRLPTGWHTIHAVPIGSDGSDIDHVVIGPAGVFTLNTKCHPDGKVTVYEHMIYVNGFKQPYIRNSKFEAERSAKLLSDACGFEVPVGAVIVFVDIIEFVEKGTPQPPVSVTQRRRLRAWLQAQPTILATEQVNVIHQAARNSATWQQR